MNNIRQIQALNKRELENAIFVHADYRDTAYVYIGGLPYDLSEGDIITIFSQYGEPVYVNLVRDKETGKSRGFAFLKYEDQRSTDLAVDNLGGATVLGRILRVDHVRYKKRDDDEEDTNNVAKSMGEAVGKEADRDTDDEGQRRKKRRTSEDREPPQRRLLKEEIELEELIRNHDEEDPMKEFLIEEKREEVSRALEREARHEKSRRRGSSRDRSGHHSRHHRRHRNEERTRSRERSSRDHQERPRRDRSYRDRTPEGSRSPEPRRDRNRERRDRHR
ncbi:hypothetical protein ARAM_004914 [Aspergillus rambellii]|uniref:RRM domain-containing protein n=1 Tax=Aspergillus rambellii TaxID=308745 RepID=A0A0F8UV76_9EURO|nr:hypothetical protein ARAM_004914 [Aspergillus rambellii]